MNEKEYKKISTNKLGLYNGDCIRRAAQKVNLTIQSVLKDENLITKQLDSMEPEEIIQTQQVAVTMG
jgi:hypothetical protein